MSAARAETAAQRDWHLPRSRPYVWRDPARVTPERAAELALLDEAEGVRSCCGYVWYFCRCAS